jgi:hypothetical protein
VKHHQLMRAGLAAALLAMGTFSFASSPPVQGAAVRDTKYVQVTRGRGTVMVVCLDITASVPDNRGVFASARSLVARTVKAVPRPGSGRYIGYVRTISSNSIDTSNNLLKLDIPAVQLTKRITPPAFTPIKERRKYDEAYARAHAQELTALAQAKHKANAYATQISRVTAKADNRGTDLYDCPKVAERLYYSGYNRQLLIVSDLVPSNQPKGVTFRLSGAHVTVFQYCGHNAALCDKEESSFSTLLRKAKVTASNLHFYDASAMDTCHDAFKGC